MWLSRLWSRPPCPHEQGAWQPWPRCLDCGHRIPDLEVPRTRDLDALLWPYEIAGRMAVRRIRRKLRHNAAWQATIRQRREGAGQ